MEDKVRVVEYESTSYGLGISVEFNETYDLYQIIRARNYGIIASSGHMKVGDFLVSVNGQQLNGMRGTAVWDYLRKLYNCTVVIKYILQDDVNDEDMKDNSKSAETPPRFSYFSKSINSHQKNPMPKDFIRKTISNELPVLETEIESVKIISENEDIKSEETVLETNYYPKDELVEDVYEEKYEIEEVIQISRQPTMERVEVIEREPLNKSTQHQVRFIESVEHIDYSPINGNNPWQLESSEIEENNRSSELPIELTNETSKNMKIMLPGELHHIEKEKEEIENEQLRLEQIKLEKERRLARLILEEQEAQKLAEEGIRKYNETKKLQEEKEQNEIELRKEIEKHEQILKSSFAGSIPKILPAKFFDNQSPMEQTSIETVDSEEEEDYSSSSHDSSIHMKRDSKILIKKSMESKMKSVDIPTMDNIKRSYDNTSFSNDGEGKLSPIPLNDIESEKKRKDDYHVRINSNPTVTIYQRSLSQQNDNMNYHLYQANNAIIKEKTKKNENAFKMNSIEQTKPKVRNSLSKSEKRERVGSVLVPEDPFKPHQTFEEAHPTIRISEDLTEPSVRSGGKNVIWDVKSFRTDASNITPVPHDSEDDTLADGIELEELKPEKPKRENKKKTKKNNSFKKTFLKMIGLQTIDIKQ
ncbi:hypothetical protein SNEBB_004588 [Seison nebaliae]|nr:hypothetical protein SNEBB_004588 [Seison nebaliae]